MNAKSVRENLGRAKTYYQRKDLPRALASMVVAIREIGTAQAPTDIRSLLREVVQILSRDATIKDTLKAPLIYQPGQEKNLLAPLAKVYQSLRSTEGQEDHKTALNRKLKIDENLNYGIKALEQKKVSEADAFFGEALKYYKTEHAVFTMIAKALMAAGEFRRAYPYLKRGVEVAPNNIATKELMAECLRQRQGAAS